EDEGLLDVLKLFAERAEIEFLDVKFCGSDKFRNEVYDLLKDFERIGSLTLTNKSEGNELPMDGLLLDFSKLKHNNLSVNTNGYISQDTIHQVCKTLLDGQSERYISCYGVK
ncbi:hypothetical protein PMAYCL1PPCAC_00479, partial [Pristionchus mayeri]